MKNRAMSYIVEELIKNVKDSEPLEISNFTYAGNRYRNSHHNDGLEVLKHPGITFDNILEFYNGFSGKELPRNPNNRDINIVIDIINQSRESSRLTFELYEYVKNNKSEEKANFNSIW